jgi:hypothetical protein
MLRARLPLEHETMRRLGEEHFAPAPLRAVRGDFGELAVRSRLAHDADGRARAAVE